MPDSKVQDLLQNPTIASAIKRIMQLSRNLSPDEQLALSKRLSAIPLTKTSSHQKSKSSARRGDFFEDKKEKEAPKEKAPKEKEAPLTSFEQAIKGNQVWRRYKIRLSRETNPEARAKSVFSIISTLPKQDQKFKLILRNLLER